MERYRRRQRQKRKDAGTILASVYIFPFVSLARASVYESPAAVSREYSSRKGETSDGCARADVPQWLISAFSAISLSIYINTETTVYIEEAERERERRTGVTDVNRRLNFLSSFHFFFFSSFLSGTRREMATTRPLSSCPVSK